ncbi:MAG: hypothetical protein ACOZAN_03390 [Patescibacteria group bacterium]
MRLPRIIASWCNSSLIEINNQKPNHSAKFARVCMKGESSIIQLEVETAIISDDPTYRWRSHLSK